jgi:hypothetical protein
MFGALSAAASARATYLPREAAGVRRFYPAVMPNALFS